MPKGEILYINSVGGFRKRKVDLDPTLPIVVKNHKDKQAHALDEKPVYGLLPPAKFDSIADLLAADPPADPLVVQRWGIVCADNAVWPLSPQSLDQYTSHGISQLDGDDSLVNDTRHLKYQEYYEEATQRVMHEAEKADSKDGYLTAVSFTLGMVACLVLILVAAMISYYKWGPAVGGDAAATTSLLAMLGTVGVAGCVGTDGDASNPVREKSPRPITPARTRKPRRRKPGKGDAWVTGTIFDHPTLGGKIWQAHLRYSTWIADPAITEACIFRPDLLKLRKTGTLLCGAVISGALFSIGYAGAGVLGIPGVPGVAGGVAGLIVGAVLGTSIGWIAGPAILGNRPRIMLARVPDDNNTRILVPIEHNYCRTTSVGDYIHNLETVMARLDADGDDEDNSYEPVVFRATTFYDDLAARDEIAEVSSPKSILQKVQIGVMAVMAFGSVGLLFFIAMATTE